jgi:glycogen debranching enzyme
MTLTILDGSTFCVCADDGAMEETSHGFYTDDTRFVSQLILNVNGVRPKVLSAASAEYFAAAIFLRNAAAANLQLDDLLIRCERFVTDDLQDHLVLTNLTAEDVMVDIDVRIEADFSDILSIKQHDLVLGDPAQAPGLCTPVALTAGATPRLARLTSPAGDLWTEVRTSRDARVANSALTFASVIPGRGEWDVRISFRPHTGRVRPGQTPRARHFGEQRSRIQRSLKTWNLRIPRLQATWPDLAQAYSRSVADLAALRMRGSDGLGLLPAAGMPWFMTVFGRDTVLTCLQTLVFGPELAMTALRVLSRLQAQADDPEIDAEPGKIIHELRRGRAAEVWFARYYGSVDATPLFLILLSETWRWTCDDGFVRELERPLRAALNWLDEFGDRDRDGFVEFSRRSRHGLEVQSWKDSPDSLRFADGRNAGGPIAACEVQGYVYDAKLRCAELARVALGDESLAARLERDAAGLRERFDRAFWIEREGGGFYALALDGQKRQVDSCCSNMGHLLWSGIVPEARVGEVARTLMGEALWSGWGVRTMSTADAAYSPLAYHRGTVWPHDNSLIAHGLAERGEADASLLIVRSMLEAARFFEGSLPEVFAGLPRRETPFPVAYPTASRPQAWAAGAPVLLLRALLGLRPDPAQRRLTVRKDRVPDWAGDITLAGIPAFGRAFDVHLRNGRATVAEM